MTYDLIEAVLRRPKMYTILGSYPEVVSFLEGYYSGFAKHSLEAQHVLTWSLFRRWLAIKLGNPKSSELKVLYQDFGDKSLDTLISFYHEFKSEVST